MNATVTYNGIIKKWDRDNFKFTLELNGQSFDYFMGMGHAKKNKLDKYMSVPKVPAKNPTVDEILHCLFLDSEALDMSLVDWCDNFGYNYDSVRDRRLYDDCCEIGLKLKKALGDKYYSEKERIQALD